MLRLESHCHYWVPKISKVSCRGQMRLPAPFFNHQVWTSLRVVTIKALNDEKGGASTGKELWDLGLEVEVPFEQRPVNEYSSLKDGPLYSWGELSPGAFFLRLGDLWLTAFTILGVPIAAASFNPSRVC